jgi:dihydrofolate reductase
VRVIAMAVISVDGCLTRHDEAGSGFASREDQEHFRATMRACGATIMGRATFDAERERILAAPAGGLLRTVMTRRPADFAALERPGALEFRADSPDRIVASLAGRGYKAVALLGGSQIFDLFIEADLVTEWRITVEPRFFGTGARLLSRATDRRLVLTDRQPLNETGTLLLTYTEHRS